MGVLRTPEGSGQLQSIIWSRVVIYGLILHIAALYGLYLLLFYGMWQTILAVPILQTIGQFGSLGGAHRLWSHRSYKVRLPLKIILIIAHCISMEGSIIFWAHNHRIHHKWVDTDADPYNSRRGFFYSHMGWMLMTEHPEVAKKWKAVDVSDLMADPLLRFQEKCWPWGFYFLSYLLIPMLAHYWWGETFWTAFFILGQLRVVLSVHGSFSINSVAHMFGTKPYDKNIYPTENRFVALVSSGEGWHNYHHSFPYDYRASELPYYFNMTTILLDIFKFLGQVQDAKTASEQSIAMKKLRSGDDAGDTEKYIVTKAIDFKG